MFSSMRSRRRHPDQGLAAFGSHPFIRRMACAAKAHQALIDPQAEIYKALEERRANLDRRVKSGEISSSTRARYLRVYQRQLIESLGCGRPRWPERTLVAVLAPLLAKDRVTRT